MVEHQRQRPRRDRRRLAFVLGIRIPAVDGVENGVDLAPYGGQHDEEDAAEHRHALHQHLAVDRRALAAHELLERRRVEQLEELFVVEGDAGQPHERVGARVAHPQ